MFAELTAVFERIGLNIHSVIALLLAGVFGLALAMVIMFVLNRVAKYRKAGLVAAISARCAAPLRALVPVLAMSIVLPGVEMSSGGGPYLERLLNLLGIAMTGWLATRVVRGFVDHLLTVYDIDVPDNLEARRIQTQIRVLARVTTFAIVLATVAGLIMYIPAMRNIGVSLFASAGIAGIAVGLAARPALSNLIAGIQIALTQPIRIEDAVVVEGEWGWVEQIHMTYVVIRIWDLRRLILPISYFIEKPFQNWTRTTADLLGSVILHMDYRVPLDEIRAEFGRVVRASKYWDGKVEVVHVVDSTEKTMQVRLLMSASNSPDAWELRCEVRERLIVYLQRHHPDSLPRLRVEHDGGRKLTASPEEA